MALLLSVLFLQSTMCEQMWLRAHKSDSHEQNGKGCGFLLPTLP